MNYKTTSWRKLRERILRRDGYRCQYSKRDGKHIEANTVHHIFPASQFPEYAWCDWNLVSLSVAAHNRMHIRDTDELTDEGRALMERIARQRGIKTN